jgi:stearoyl-CoA desaturase (delta-9 desaturase)
VIPFVLVHLTCLFVFVVGVSPVAVIVAVLSYALRMFAITAFYHRYFSHRSFETSRLFATLMAFVGGGAAQRGAIWWAAHHRHHHAVSDRAEDIHSPVVHGFWRSHVTWFLDPENTPTRDRYVKDLLSRPELVWLDRHDWLPPLCFATLIFTFGAILETARPEWGTERWQMVVWGFFVSTTLLYHATYTINSLAHRFGSRRYETGDESRNNLWLALLTFGEGWHNNHHHRPSRTRQGVRWWEIDLSYLGLWGLEKLGVVRGIADRPIADGKGHPALSGRGFLQPGIDQPTIPTVSNSPGPDETRG